MIVFLQIILSLSALLSQYENIDQVNKIDIKGEVITATQESIDEETLVTLQVFEDETLLYQRNVMLGEDNHFIFPDVEIEDNWRYVVFVEYEGVKFSSRTIHGNEIEEGESQDLMITVYSSTDSDENLLAERVHIFINFPQTGVVRLTELYTVINSGNEIIIPTDDEHSNLQFTLPTGAINLQIQSENTDSENVITEYGFYELAYIYPLPSQHQILYRYDLPYESEKLIRFILPMNVQNAVLAIPYYDIEVESNEFVPTGTRTLEGELVQLYMATDIEKGQIIWVKITGLPGAKSVLGNTSQQHLLISIVFFVPIVIVFIIWLINNHKKLRKKRQRINDLDYEKETILDEIVALDDLYRSNQLAIDVYQNRRNELLLMLKEILVGSE